MRLLTLAVLLLVPEFANASPWFDQSQAEQMVAQAMPEYYTHLNDVAKANPDKYQDKLHQALVMVVNADVYPELVSLWNRKWQTEARFQKLVTEWKDVKSPADRDAIRAEMLAVAEQMQALSLEIFQFKLDRSQERVDRLHLQIADLDMNEDMLALEKVMNALDEY